MSDDPTERLNAALEGRYRVVRELGEGGMATVYLADDLRHERKVALKVLKPELAAVVGPDRFLAEIKTTANLQHSHILPLFDSGEADSYLFYVMPYVDGESLRARLDREHQLPVNEAVQIARNVAEALDHAHSLGVIHRDIKPANILLQAGKPVVSDFGIALAVDAAGGHRLTETGLSLGTPQYMSPEQATGDLPVGPASDIYSLGCVLYEMLVGEPPHTGRTAQAVLGKVITSDPEAVTSLRRAVLPHVNDTVAKSLERLPADRFGSAADFARALDDSGFRHGVAVHAYSATRTRLKALTIAGWGLAAVLGGVALASAFGSEPDRPTRVLSLATLDGWGTNEWMAFTPDGSALVMANAPRDAAHSLIVQRLDDLVHIPVPGSEGAYDVSVSPDGQTVAFARQAGLYAAPLTGGPARLLQAGSVLCCVRWGADGYVYFRDGGDIRRTRAGGGPSELVLEATENDGEDFIYYEPLAGGARAILSVDSDPDRIELMDVRTGRREVLTVGVRPFVTSGGHLVFARQGEGIFAAGLDADAMQLTVGPVPMVEGLAGLDVPDAPFALSESGDLAYWAGSTDTVVTRELVWVDRDGDAVGVDGTWLREFEAVEISPSGARAAVTVGSLGDTDIWLKDLDEGSARRLTSYGGMNRRPVWSPEGESVAFITDRGGKREVYVVRVDGISSPELLHEHRGRDIDEVLWSPDGDWLIYRTGTTPGDRDIHARRLRPDTATIPVSARPDIDERAPVLSPNGRWLAYVSDETGQDEVWVRPFPDVGRGSRQVSTDLGVEPVWSGDGAELFFRSRLGLVAVEIEQTPDFTTGSVRTLFPSDAFWPFSSHRAYAFDENRDRFLMIRDVQREPERPELILVQNFLAEVGRRIPSG